MGDKTQIGARIDEDLYSRFKQAVEQKHGRTRGVISHEVENALREYVNAEHPTDSLSRIENDVATTKAKIARIEQAVTDGDGGQVVSESGGTPTPSTAETTHTHRSDKPHAKATIDEKVEWLIDDVFDDRDSGAYVRADLIEMVRKRYSLSDVAVERMVDAMLRKVGAKDTPQDNDLLAWGDRLDMFRDQARKTAEEEADADFDRIDEAEPDG